MHAYQKAAEQDATCILGKVSMAAQEYGVQCEMVTVTETAAVAIIEAAKSKQCDLIVMSSHGRRGLARQPGNACTNVKFCSRVEVRSPVLRGRARSSGSRLSRSHASTYFGKPPM